MVNPVRNLKPTSLENFSNGVKALLVLSDGTVFEGKNFGSEGETIGEVVFNTSMTGYQEILTDPSYKGQIVAMTYPEIGNVGVNAEDVESRRPSVDLDPARLIAKAKASPGLLGRDLVKEVTCGSAYVWEQGCWALEKGYATRARTRDRATPFVVAYDFGIKLNILRRLVETGFRVTVVPAWTAAEEVLAMGP